MTLTSQTNRVQYAGNGSQTAFPITFVYWQDADIQAVHTDANGAETSWVFGTHYTLEGGDGGIGTLTVETAPTDYTPMSGETLTIASALDDHQETSLPEGGSFPSASVEQQLDKIVRLIQQKAEQLGRALKLPISSATTNLEIPEPSASQFLRWNAGATALENADISAQGSIGIPVTVAEGGTGATTAATARTALGIPGTEGSIGEDIASASSLTLGSDGYYFVITGTASVNSIGTLGAGTIVKLHFDDRLTLVHHAVDLVLPGGADITTAAGDEAEFVEYATGKWRMIGWVSANTTARRTLTGQRLALFNLAT